MIQIEYHKLNLIKYHLTHSSKSQLPKYKIREARWGSSVYKEF